MNEKATFREFESVAYEEEKNIKDIEGCIPNSRTDYYDEVTGKLLQQRWYDAEGKAIWDRDWDHGDKQQHTFPHDHYWSWGDLGNSGRLAYNGLNGEKTNMNYC